MGAAAITMNEAAAWRPAVNPWIIALTVTLATFMEVLDTSIANVALPHIAGSLSAGQDESTWVLDVLSRLQRHRAAAERLALFDRRTQEFLHGLCRAVHDQFVPVRARPQSRHAHLLPRPSGRGRRRLAAERAGHPRRYLSSRQARHGIRCLWHRGGDGSGHRSYARWLDHRQLHLALDFLHQYPGRHSFAFADLTAHPGSSLLQASPS